MRQRRIDLLARRQKHFLCARAKLSREEAGIRMVIAARNEALDHDLKIYISSCVTMPARVYLMTIHGNK